MKEAKYKAQIKHCRLYDDPWCGRIIVEDERLYNKLFIGTNPKWEHLKEGSLDEVLNRIEKVEDDYDEYHRVAIEPECMAYMIKITDCLNREVFRNEYGRAGYWDKIFDKYEARRKIRRKVRYLKEKAKK